jgi:hypothetical protein
VHKSSIVGVNGIPFKEKEYVAVPPVMGDLKLYATQRSVGSPGFGLLGENPNPVIEA